MFRAIRDYFVPTPPNEMSRESAQALSADIKAKGLWGELGDSNRGEVDAWVRHADRRARAANREWLKPRAKHFAGRWAVVSGAASICAWLADGRAAFEVPLTMAGFVAACIAMVLFLVHRSLNK